MSRSVAAAVLYLYTALVLVLIHSVSSIDTELPAIEGVIITTETVSLPTVAYVGEFTCTAYCPCLECCGQYAVDRPGGIVYGASGQRLISGHSVAVDPRVIPYGTILQIDGQEYVAADTGSFSGRRLDFYFDTHEEAIAFGHKTKEVYIKFGG